MRAQVFIRTAHKALLLGVLHRRRCSKRKHFLLSDGVKHKTVKAQRLQMLALDFVARPVGFLVFLAYAPP